MHQESEHNPQNEKKLASRIYKVLQLFQKVIKVKVDEVSEQILL